MGAELSALGGRVVLLRHAIGLGAEGQIEPGIYQADLTDAGTAGRLVDLVRREHGPIGGIVHLLPLAEREHFEAMDLAGWRAALARDVKSLFHVARASAHDLRQAGDGRGAWVLAATTMGAAYEEDPSLRRPFFPGQGGIAGLVKTLALEWPGVHCKVVGLDADDPANGPLDALRGAREMLMRLEQLNRELKNELTQPLQIGIGIHYSEAIVGMMGPPRSMIITAIGDTVNTTARLESLTKEYGAPLIVSRYTADMCGTSWPMMKSAAGWSFDSSATVRKT